MSEGSPTELPETDPSIWLPEPDRPWLMRTYGGHSSAKISNEMYRDGIARGLTGLSVAFDLPTQKALGSDHPRSQGEVGVVGVPIDSLGDMKQLFKDIPLDEVNTSMTINATAPWLLALYVAAAEEQDVDRRRLRGTTQNDLMKEFLSRNTQAFPLEASLRLQNDVIEFAMAEIPKWNPINICGYHLQEAGANTVQETAYMFYNALNMLDEFRPGSERASRAGIAIGDLIGRTSFFLDFNTEFVDGIAKAKAMRQMWDEYTLERYGVKDPEKRHFRYGVQVNSVGLTEQQPENNVLRILFSFLAPILSRDARARAIQLPAWNEALGLPGSWDQQWALRMQQVAAYETDILKHPDIFDGSTVIEGLTRQIITAAEEERHKVEKIRDEDGQDAALKYMKGEIDDNAYAQHMRRESGELTVVGVNRFEATEESPLPRDGAIVRIDPKVEQEQIARTRAFMEQRDGAKAEQARAALHEAASLGENIMPASIAAAKAGLTTREWGEAMREVFG